MSKLVVRALRCEEETDEAGSDDIYMAVFRGSFTLPPNVKVVGGKNTIWANMTSGKLVLKDMALEDTYHQGDVYVAALFDQDSNLDLLLDNTLAKVIEYWAKYWTLFPGAAGHEMCATSALIVGGALGGNDEFLGVRNISPIYTVGGIGQLLTFSGDGGSYRARAVLR